MLETEPLVRTRDDLTSKRSNSKAGIKKLSTRVKVILGLLIALFIIIIAVVASNPATKSTNWVQIENIDTNDIPSVWKWDSFVDKNDKITLTFALKQENIEKFEEELLAVSDPKSSKYGQHWDYEKVHNLLAPSTKSVNSVKHWLKKNGISANKIVSITPNNDFIKVEMTIEDANNLLKTEFGYWKHLTSGSKHIRVKKHYFVPSHISQHLDFVSPTLRFPVTSHTNKLTQIFNIETIKANNGKIDITDSDNNNNNENNEDNSDVSSDSTTTTYVLPSNLKSLYGATNYKGGNSDSNYQAIASFINEWYNDDDLNQFWDFFDIESSSVERIPSVQPEGYGTEAELDVQYITAMGEKVNTLVWDIEDDLYFVSLLKQIASDDYPTPSVVSMSYGGDEPSVGFGYTMRANIEFGKVGLMGVTFFASSGDAGVLSSDSTCNEGSYVATFPASSPYVTAIGGTTGGIASDTTEEAWTYSGGGFSSFFDQKSFQKEAINYYLNNNDNLPDSSKYVSTGAGYPDLSAQSEDFVICDSGSYWAVSGTSAACPTVAGMIALVNDARLANGKSSLGWLNPAIYGIYNDGSQSDYFNDIVTGYNEGCSSGNTGFYTNEGWDPVTGLGTLKLDKLYDYLLNL